MNVEPSAIADSSVARATPGSIGPYASPERPQVPMPISLTWIPLWPRVRVRIVVACLRWARASGNDLALDRRNVAWSDLRGRLAHGLNPRPMDVLVAHHGHCL